MAAQCLIECLMTSWALCVPVRMKDQEYRRNSSKSSPWPVPRWLQICKSAWHHPPSSLSFILEVYGTPIQITYQFYTGKGKAYTLQLFSFFVLISDCLLSIVLERWGTLNDKQQIKNSTMSEGVCFPFRLFRWRLRPSGLQLALKAHRHMFFVYNIV